MKLNVLGLNHVENTSLAIFIFRSSFMSFKSLAEHCPPLTANLDTYSPHFPESLHLMKCNQTLLIIYKKVCNSTHLTDRPWSQKADLQPETSCNQREISHKLLKPRALRCNNWLHHFFFLLYDLASAAAILALTQTLKRYPVLGTGHRSDFLPCDTVMFNSIVAHSDPSL